MDIMQIALLADKYKNQLDEEQNMCAISDIVDEIFKDIELAKMVLKKYVYSN